MSSDSVIKIALIAIAEVIIKADYACFDSGFDISVNDKETSPIKATLTVVVPKGQKRTAAADLEDKLSEWRVDSSKTSSYLSVYLGKFIQDKTRIKIVLKEESVPKTFEKPSGENKTSRGSANTAIVESAQCLYCDLAFNVYKGRIDENSLISKDDFDKAFKNIEVDAKLEEMLSMSSAWKTSSIRGANELYNKLHTEGTFKFYRNSGVDVLINKAYNKIKGDAVVAGSKSIKDKVPASEDKWNPADIWMTKIGFDHNKIIEKSQTKKVLTFNKFLIDEFNDNNLIGVSLKKITGSADLKPMNLTKDREISKVGYGGAKFNYKSLDTYIDFKSGSNTSIQFRNFSGSRGGWQGEVGIKGSSAKHGKIGAGAIWEVLKSHGVSYSSRADNNQKFYDECGGSENEQNTIAKEIYNLLTKFPANDRPISNIGTEDKEVTKNVSNGQRWMYAKFLGLTLIDAIVGADNSDEIVQDIYLYASSQHSLSGVYYKLT